MSTDTEAPTTPVDRSDALLGFWVVELEKGVWITDMEGDPGRTLSIKKAQKFPSFAKAEAALDLAKTFRRFRSPSIYKPNANC